MMHHIYANIINQYFIDTRNIKHIYIYIGPSTEIFEK